MPNFFKQLEENLYEDAKLKNKEIAQIKEEQRKNQIIEMTNKRCAVRTNFEYCTTSCSHFNEGYVRVIDDCSILNFQMPSCRLWRN